MGSGELDKMSLSLFGVGEYKVPERNSLPIFPLWVVVVQWRI